MALSPEDVVRFDIYSLFCHHMVERLPSLHTACIDGKPDLDSCVKGFDKAFESLFQNSVVSRSNAIDIVSLNLKAAAANIPNSEAAAVIDEARKEALATENSWNYTKAMDGLHELGRNLAVVFFQSSPWPTTTQRLHLRATLNYQNGRNRAAQLRALIRDLPPSPHRERLVQLEHEIYIREFKEVYKGLPGALYIFEGMQPGSYEINVPFTPSNGLMFYASYPFLFMHEYTAHIFANDYLNDRFNDGWMLCAASQYLVENWVHESDSCLSALNWIQAYAFKRYLVGTLMDESSAHHESAKHIHDFLLSWDPSRFQSYTYELAAYQPTAGESDKWPTEVLRALALEYGQNRGALRKRIQQTTSLSALYPGLKLKPPTIR